MMENAELILSLNKDLAVDLPGNISYDELRDQLAGHINHLIKNDFDIMASHLKIPEKTIQNTYAKISKKITPAIEWIDVSFLPEKMKAQYKTLIEERIKIFQV